MTYQMTPARRAALRKAQLISAQRRRKHTSLGYAAHNTRQRVAIAYREGQLRHYRTHEPVQVVGSKVKRLPAKAARKGGKYVLKRAAIGTAKAGLTLGAATAVGYTAYGMTSSGKLRARDRAAKSHLGSMGYGRNTYIKSSRVHPVFGAPVRALPVGPKGRATIKRRATILNKRKAGM